MEKKFEIRDPIHGFIHLNEWEREVVNHSAFQRLRRIKQLASTDYVYPSAVHTRFEHSLGVMETASKMFDAIVAANKKELKDYLGLDENGSKIYRQIIRFAALLHDIGHPPFSHAGEQLMPSKDKNKYEHEDYSAKIIKYLFKDIIEDHKSNTNCRISINDISNLIDPNIKKPINPILLFFKPIISSQIDADRADYLLRDSYHCGVEYGKYDLNRLINTFTLVKDRENDTLKFAIDESGFHVAESFLIARYLATTQIYFHRTRQIYDYHLAKAVEHVLVKELKKGKFPVPDSKEALVEYCKFDDWKVLGLIHDSDYLHCKILKERKHWKTVYETPENSKEDDIAKAKDIFRELKENFEEHITIKKTLGKEWYKSGDPIYILLSQSGENRVDQLKNISEVAKGLKPLNRVRIYCDEKIKTKCLIKIKELQ